MNLFKKSDFATFVDRNFPHLIAKLKLSLFKQAKSEEQKCNSRSKSKAIYLSLAASTLKRLRSQIAEDFNVQKKTSESSIVLPVKSIKTSPLKVAFKTNNIRVAHNTSPTKAAAIIMNKIAPKTKNATAGKSRRKNNFSILKEERQNSRSGLWLVCVLYKT